ncbi:MAG TPA: endonuclease/exonuclease/phosphatase family protein [Burkholderiaceae bacterium]|nr:endonuclease/exonuclease/phosphatase family protein [Burkholderiaceae bacterium]
MKLLTWNIQWGRGVDGRVDLDRIVAHARRFADFDVLCLQEVSAAYPELPGCDGSDQFAAIAKRLPAFVAIDGVATDTPHPQSGRRRFGNMVLSRLPVGPVFRHLLPWPADPDSMSMQRVAVEATVQAEFGPVRVITTHLEYYSVRQRRAQVDRLRALHAEAVEQAQCTRPGGAQDGPFHHVPRAASAVLCGDFNCGPTSEERQRLMAPIDGGTPRFIDAWEIMYPRREHEPTLGVHDHEQWPEPLSFDTVYVSADVAPRVKAMEIDASSDASDHQPVMVEIR